ncbi:MAG: hypothetical protein U9R74_00735, partial [Pseudomonadota bacterium]|nr:hypothetical protein [Pseudomonadota bacterium]
CLSYAPGQLARSDGSSNHRINGLQKRRCWVRQLILAYIRDPLGYCFLVKIYFFVIQFVMEMKIAGKLA